MGRGVSSLDGRPAMVTGGGQGVGRGIALALAAEGAHVAVLGRTEATLRDACDEIEERGGRATAIVCDVRELGDITHAVDAVVTELGPPRILVNNAQMFPHGTLLDLPESSLDDAWRSGPLAAFRLMRACHPHLRDGGVIINVSSGAPTLAGPPGLAGYAAVKSALQTFSRAAAVEWGADGIRVNTIMPFVWSDAFKEWEKNDPDTFSTVLDQIPLRKLGDAEHDVGRLVVFLAGPDAQMITGTGIPIDGGGTYLR
jgi:meso-butanediol dehydrogenase/(S,S)-butanediol dehydrogenase/diacetyl reductase